VMQVLEAHGKAPRRNPPWLIILGVVLVALVVGGFVIKKGKSSPPPKKSNDATNVVVHHGTPLTVVSSSPASGAQGVASNADLSVTFSTPVSLGSVQPTLSPSVAGTWEQTSPTTIRYDLSAPLIPSQAEVLTIPAGTSGVKGKNGDVLTSPDTIQFSIATGDTLRLQELLAEAEYLPLSFTPTGSPPPPQDAAMPELGNFAWRWPDLPTNLTSLWAQGSESIITKAAVMTYENQHGMTVDGLAGPAVWTSLLADEAAKKVDPDHYNYVLVNKVQPENLTLYEDGTPEFTGVPVNTGAPGADTQDGTFAVFEHVVSSVMKGTNPDGTKYDDPDVPWASFFNGGDALHGFVRAHYGFPQSNGCVEMSVANAQVLWPDTPIGTLVTVVGPSSGPGPPTTTTTTTTTSNTAPPPAPTTTVPPTTTPPTAVPPTTAAA
jgi:lipoprotein-anchoring transpeptidase ErfK/SrfK